MTSFGQLALLLMATLDAGRSAPPWAVGIATVRGESLRAGRAGFVITADPASYVSGVERATPGTELAGGGSNMQTCGQRGLRIFTAARVAIVA